jgi:hypothetical protein
MIVDYFREKILNGFYRFSDHAVKRMIKREISRHEVEFIIHSGEIIEEYRDDKYSPSCLIYGITKSGRIIHVLLSETPVVIIITVYEPDPAEWIDGKIRG